MLDEVDFPEEGLVLTLRMALKIDFAMVCEHKLLYSGRLRLTVDKAREEGGKLDRRQILQNRAHCLSLLEDDLLLEVGQILALSRARLDQMSKLAAGTVHIREQEQVRQLDNFKVDEMLDDHLDDVYVDLTSLSDHCHGGLALNKVRNQFLDQ